MIWQDFTALFSVIIIDIALAGDNALVIGMAAAGLPRALRRRAVMMGTMGAAGLRIVLASVTVQLLAIIGLMAAGGLLLLWVGWKLWRETRAQAVHPVSLDDPDAEPDAAAPAKPTKTLRQAIVQIVAADVSMSLDNTLAVAGAARDNVWILVIGLALSVALTGLVAGLISRIIHRYRWIAYVGVAIVVYVALSMIWDGSHQIVDAVTRG